MSEPTRTLMERLLWYIHQETGRHMKPETRIASRLDSMERLDLISSLEEAFELSIPDRDAQKWRTVADIERYLKAQGRE